MTPQETLYTIALARLAGHNLQAALHVWRSLGSAQAAYDHRHDLADAVPGCTPKLAATLARWDDALAVAEREAAFMERHHIKALGIGDDDYPRRLAECPDAPLVLFSMGTADLNARRVVSVVGTRRATPYGADIIRRFTADLAQRCPGVLVVSGLAYGVDICAHREALAQGLPTVGVLAHGLDDLYPPRHRDTARQMLAQGGLLTEYTSQTRPDKLNFVRRNRIVAGMADAVVVVESAAKGGALITAHIAQDYGRAVFAYPGNVGAPYSEGCNRIIRDQVAALATSADDVADAMGWDADEQRRQGVERQLFPELDADEKAVAELLQRYGDLQLATLAVKANIPVGRLVSLLMGLEMKGVVRALAGGNYHLLA